MKHRELSGGANSISALWARRHITKSSKWLVAYLSCARLYPNALHMLPYFVLLTSTLQMRRMKHREVL